MSIVEGFPGNVFTGGYTPPPRTLSSISVSGPGTVNEGGNGPYVATGIYSDDTEQNLTASVVWTTTGGAMDANGVLTIPVNNTHNDQRTVTVTASFGGKTSIPYPVVIMDTTPVTLTSISINGPTSVDEGGSGTFTATGLYSNNTSQDITASVVWSTTQGSIAAGVLTVASNSVQGDDRNSTVTASKDGITSQNKSVYIIDTTILEPLEGEILITATYAAPPTNPTALVTDTKHDAKVTFLLTLDDGHASAKDIYAFLQTLGPDFPYHYTIAVTGNMAGPTYTTIQEYAPMLESGLIDLANHTWNHVGNEPDLYKQVQQLERYIYDQTGYRTRAAVIPNAQWGLVSAFIQEKYPIISSTFGEMSKDSYSDWMKWDSRFSAANPFGKSNGEQTKIGNGVILASRRWLFGSEPYDTWTLDSRLDTEKAWIDGAFAASTGSSAATKYIYSAFSHGPSGTTGMQAFASLINHIKNHPSNADKRAAVLGMAEAADYFVQRDIARQHMSVAQNGNTLTIRIDKSQFDQAAWWHDLCLRTTGGTLQSVTVAGVDSHTFTPDGLITLRLRNTPTNPNLNPIPAKIISGVYQGNKAKIKFNKTVLGTNVWTPVPQYHGNGVLNGNWYGGLAVTDKDYWTNIRNEVIAIEGTGDERILTFANNYQETYNGTPIGLSYQSFRSDWHDGTSKAGPYFSLPLTLGTVEATDPYAPLAVDEDPQFSIANNNPEQTGDVPYNKYDYYILEGDINDQDGLPDGSPMPAVNGTTIGKFLTVWNLKKRHVKLGQIKALNKVGEDAAGGTWFTKDAEWYAVYKGDHLNKKVLLGTNPGVKSPNGGETIELVPASPLNDPRELSYLVRYGPKTLPKKLTITGKFKEPVAVVYPERPKRAFRVHLGGNGFVWNFSQDDSNGGGLTPAQKTVKNAILKGGWRIYFDAPNHQPAQGKFLLSPNRSNHNFDLMFANAKAADILMLAVWRGQSLAQEKSFQTNLPELNLNRWMERAEVFAPTFAQISTNGAVDNGKVQVWLETITNWDSDSQSLFQLLARWGTGKKADGSDNTAALMALCKVVEGENFLDADGNNVDHGTRTWDKSIKKVGLNQLTYVQIGNEDDKWWQGNGGPYYPVFSYRSGRAYAARCSAGYDGHKGAMGAGRGAKNADPFCKVVATGIARAQDYFWKGFLDWNREYRGYKKDANGTILVDTAGKGIVDLPCDAIAFHNYQNNGGGQYSGGNRGVPPELGNFHDLVARLIKMMKEDFPGIEIWMTEVGYDVGMKSDQRAELQGQAAGYYVTEPVPADYFTPPYAWKDTPSGQAFISQTLATRINRQRAQMDWSLRCFFHCWRLGVDRTFYYWANNTGHPSPTGMDEVSIYVSSGFLHTLGQRYLKQVDAIMGNAEHEQTHGQIKGAGVYLEEGYDPDTGNTVFIGWMGGETNSTGTATVPVPSGVTFGTVYSINEDGDTANAQNVSLTSGGTYSWPIGERAQYLVIPPTIN